MKTIFDSRFKLEVILIGPGDFYISKEHEIISTTLGSCISVCLYDENNQAGGINHYMLPMEVVNNESLQLGSAKYGINSMELLINGLLKKGCLRNQLKAKIFGGANMFKGKNITGPSSVGDQNIHFAKRYLLAEGIPIIKEDVGGGVARKIYFDSKTGHVRLFRIDSQSAEDIVQTEIKYRKNLQQKEIETKKPLLKTLPTIPSTSDLGKDKDDLNQKLILF